MKNNEYTINVVEQKENYSSLEKMEINDTKQNNNIRKISNEPKNIENEKKENEPKNSPEKQDLLPKIASQSSIFSNVNDKNNISNINNNSKNNNLISYDNKNNKQTINFSSESNTCTLEEFKIRFNNIIKGDLEYQNLFPLIQKGSYLTGLPDSVYNLNKNSNKKTSKCQETPKILKSLKEKEKSLNKELSTLKVKKEKLLNISYTSSSPIEKNINNYEEKRLESLEINILTKLDEVKNQIKDIYQKENDLKNNKNKIQYFFDNIDSAENLSRKYYSNYNTERMMKLQKDCNKNNQNRYKDKEKSDFKTIQENQRKYEDEIELKKQYLKEQKEIENEIVKERKKKINEKILKIKEKAKSEKNPPAKKNYLFYKMENDFEQKEKKFYKSIKLIKKPEVLQGEELKKVQKQYNEAKKEFEKKTIEKTLNMKKIWKSRFLVLPKYKSPILKTITESEKEKMEKEEEKEKEKIKFYEIKKNYFKNEVPLPKINEKTKIKKNLSMLELQGKKRVKYINEELNRINKSRINNYNLKNKRYKQSNSLNKKYKYRIKKKKDIKDGEDLNKSMELNNNSNKIRNKVISPLKPLKKKIIKRNPKNINYLKEFENNDMFKSYDWDKCIDNDENKARSIQIVKNQIEGLDDKLRRKQMMLKMNRNFSNDNKVVKDISNLLINSIKGKISVIKAINSEG